MGCATQFSFSAADGTVVGRNQPLQWAKLHCVAMPPRSPPADGRRSGKMTFSLEGHVAIITGSSTGLGKASALALGRAGAKVVVNYFNNDARAERTIAEFKQAKIESILVKADVISEEGVDRLFRETEAKLGKPDILVVNATPEQPLKPIEEYDWAFYQTMLDFF